jgi:NAD+ diphosphatase
VKRDAGLLTFAGHQHDRAVDRRADQAWLDARRTDASSRALVVTGSDIEVRADSFEPLWLPAPDVAGDEWYLLGVDRAGAARIAVHVIEPRDSASYRGLRELGVAAPAEEIDWLCHAVALAQWHAAHTHCPRCGGRTVVAAGGAERRCTVDGSSHFPRVDPAVIVLVTDAHDRVLLGHQDAWPHGRFSTLAGFVEPGETAEQAVAREVAEEAGVDVVGVELLATQPWPFPSSLMIGAVAHTDGSPEPRPDGDELADVRWFSREQLRDAVADRTVMVPGPISISRWLIDRWYGGELPDDAAGWR